MKTLVYLVGPPGVGKSTAMAALTENCLRVPRTGKVRHDTLVRPRPAPETALTVGAEIGARRERFSGTDALHMAVNPDAITWIGEENPYGLVLGEGARLANARFLLAAMMAGYDVHVAHLYAPPSVLAARRRERGSNQNPQWIRGAETKSRRIMDSMSNQGARLHWIGTDGVTPRQIATMLTARIEALEVLS